MVSLLSKVVGIAVLWATSARAAHVEQPPPGGRGRPSSPPKDCPFAASTELTGIRFTGAHSDCHCGDTRYPSWASDGNLYSPWTDGKTEAVGSYSGKGEAAETAQAILIGDGPLRLNIANAAPPQVARATPYLGRYPCGSPVYDGVWYYGTYRLGPAPKTNHDGMDFNWHVLGPVPGFRISTDYGKTWTPWPLTPEKPLFPDPSEFMGPVKFGGAENRDAKPRYANLSWITADQVYLARVTPSVENINDILQCEFFAGHDACLRPVWTHDFAAIRPVLD